ncbi:MAG: MgtC/SapB family protein, partial [Rhizomicrobium sp.]
MSGLAQVIENSAEWRLFVALAIGLLMGVERERHKQDGMEGTPEGLRSFALVSLLGGLAFQTGSAVVLGLAGFFTLLVVLASLWTGTRSSHSITTEVALVIALVLGMLAQSRPGLAISASVVVVTVIASRAPLHRFVREYLTAQDLRDGLVFSVAAMVVLPLLPDRAVDPFGLVNPFALWRLAVVLMGLSALGYWAMRALGPQYGLPLSGFAGGFVS